jgi:hypothetical protein
MNMKRSTLERVGIALILGTGLIHLLYAPVEFEEVQYMGILFVLNFVGALVAAAGMWRRQAWGWLLGLLVAAGSVVGYVLSRSTGMPGHEVEAWLLPAGIAALAMEGAFVVLAFVVWPRVVRDDQRVQRWPGSAALFGSRGDKSDLVNGAPVPRSGRVTLAVPAAAVLSLVLLGFLTAYMTTRTELITQDDLQAELGVRVTQITTTMMGDVIDVRMHITDAEKAYSLFNDHDAMPYLKVAGSDVILLPPSHGAHQMALRQDRTYYMFFPNPEHVVSNGRAVTLYFGGKRLDPMTVQE